MAGLMRLGVARALGSSLTKTTLKPRTSRNINTSSKKTSSTSSSEACPKDNKQKNWVTYGFSTVDPFIDRLSMHVTSFTSISLCLVIGGIYLIHSPDPKYLEWSQREAYLELRRRESLGLPPIDANYFDPAKIQLPSDDELGDMEIVI